jgi:23S rRNA (cytosine1962-C5)-methyltransferase
VNTPAASPVVTLARGREGPVAGRHPWIFSGAVDRISGDPQDGDEVSVESHDGTLLARGLYNSRSQIRVRCYAWNRYQRVDDALLTVRVGAAVAFRERLGLMVPGGACRLVFSEADGLSGLVVDQYGEWLSVQFTSLALWQRREAIVSALNTHAPSRGIVLRTEKGILEEEGLEIRDGMLHGEEPAGPVEIVENGLRFLVDLRTGQKTGYYMDQRDNRVRAAHYAGGRRVLDVCCYSGGFTLPLLRAGAASVRAVDISGGALKLARENLELNGMGDAPVEFEQGDAFPWLEEAHQAGHRYEMVVLDPPKLARSERGLKGAMRGYTRLNEAAVRALEPGGILVTCSCTGRVSMDRFTSVLSEVERSTTRRIRVLERHGQPADHPVAPTCPETSYLKCLVAVVE